MSRVVRIHLMLMIRASDVKMLAFRPFATPAGRPFYCSSHARTGRWTHRDFELGDGSLVGITRSR